MDENVARIFFFYRMIYSHDDVLLYFFSNAGLLKSINSESKLKDLNVSDLNLVGVQPSIFKSPAQFLTSLNIRYLLL